MTSPPDLELVEAQRVRIEPGDRIVVRYAGRLTADRADVLREHVRKVFPNVPVLILDSATTFDVVSP